MMKTWKQNLLIALVALPLGSAMARPLSSDGDYGAVSNSPGILSRIPASINAAIKGYNISWARLSPLKAKSNSLKDVADVQEEPSSIDLIYNAGLTRSLKDRYVEVEKSDQIVNSPFRYARIWERKSNIATNQAMAEWTAREIINDRLKNFFNRADQRSAPMRVMNAAKMFMGGESPDEPVKGDERPTREGLKPHGAQQAHADAGPVNAEAPAVPTKLKYKMNVVKGQGELRFTNPIVNTSVNLDLRVPVDRNALDSSDRVSAVMTKKINSLGLDSSVTYAVNKKVFGVNVSKRITNEITCNVSSQRFASDKRTAAGLRSNQSANITYSISF